MFTVYKITNKVNGKAYVGSTVRPVIRRWGQHKNNAFNPNSSCYNYPLQCAIRKYGLDNFNFEILRDNFSSLQDMINYEHEQIIALRCLSPLGYNQTDKTDRNDNARENLNIHIKTVSCQCAKIDIQNNILEIYSSYHDAARQNGFDADNNASHIRQVCKGELSNFNGLIFRDLDENGKIVIKPFKAPHGRKQVIGVKLDDPTEELIFPSISEAARVMKTDRGSIGKCIKGEERYSHVKGFVWRALDLEGNIIEVDKTIDDRIEAYNETNPLINGERHNIKEWCEIYNISTASFYKRKKEGMSTIEALTLEKRR